MNGPLSMIVKAVITFAILGIIVNDAAAVALTYYGANDIAQAVADAAASSWRTSGRDQQAATETAVEVAEQKDSTLTGFTATGSEIIVNIQVNPRATVLARYVPPLRNLGDGKGTARSSIE